MYGNGLYNQQMYMNDLQSMRDRIDRQMQQVNQPMPSQTPQINQNFQLAPSQNMGIKYVESRADVEKELVFLDTLFVDKNFTQLWYKNTAGDIKNYELKEIVVLDEKDQKIAELTAKLAALEQEVNGNAKSNGFKNANGSVATTKPTSVPNDKSSNE